MYFNNSSYIAVSLDLMRRLSKKSGAVEGCVYWSASFFIDSIIYVYVIRRPIMQLCKRKAKIRCKNSPFVL